MKILSKIFTNSVEESNSKHKHWYVYNNTSWQKLCGVNKKSVLFVVI